MSSFEGAARRPGARRRQSVCRKPHRRRRGQAGARADLGAGGRGRGEGIVLTSLSFRPFHPSGAAVAPGQARDPLRADGKHTDCAAPAMASAQARTATGPQLARLGGGGDGGLARDGGEQDGGGVLPRPAGRRPPSRPRRRRGRGSRPRSGRRRRSECCTSRASTGRPVGLRRSRERRPPGASTRRNKGRAEVKGRPRPAEGSLGVDASAADGEQVEEVMFPLLPSGAGGSPGGERPGRRGDRRRRGRR